MPKDVRILLVGDPQVGKTSLILALVSEEFPDFVPPRAEEITIPAEVTPEHVPTHIVDYSAAEQDEDALLAEIRKASVVCIVYSIDKPESVEHIRTMWLPTIRSAVGGNTKPVILIGNQIDLDPNSTLTRAVLPIMDDFVEVETCVECSAKTLANISEVFYFAQKAVLHPSAPLYSAELRELKPACVEALTRVFKICDYDNDNILSDKELNDFQCRCFNAPLQPHALNEVKDMVRQNTEEGVTSTGLTLQGFLYLHLLFIQRGRHETTWTVLRRFGYDDNLELQSTYLEPELRVPLGCCVELTSMGAQYLKDLFHRHDKDMDGCLSPEEQEDLFAVCPHLAWDARSLPSMVNTTSQGWPTLDGYMAYWTLKALLDHRHLFHFMAYAGYIHADSDSQLTAVHVTSPHSELSHSSRGCSVLHCAVVNHEGPCKVEFMRSLLSPAARGEDGGLADNRYVCGAVTAGKSTKYLVLHDARDSEHMQAMEPPYHAAVVLVNNTDNQSLVVANGLQESLEGIPTLFVGVSDSYCGGSSEKASASEPLPQHDFRIEHRFGQGTSSTATFKALVHLAMNPSAASHGSGHGTDMKSILMKVSLFVGIPVILGCVYYRYRLGQS